MIYLELFIEFLKIGLFSFGGAYGAIPIIQEAVLQKQWMNQDMFSNIVAISESTPGPIMVNAATYIGNVQGGFLGALVATTGVVLPAFVIVILIVALFQKLLKNPKMQMVLKGIKPCLMGVIIATGLYMIVTNVFISMKEINVDRTAVMILFILVTLSVIFQVRKKKPISPIALILISSFLGGFLY